TVAAGAARIVLALAMSEYDDRKKGLRKQLAQAHKGLASLSDEQRESAGEELRRLEETLGFTATVVDQTDPALIPDSVHNALSQTIESLTANAADAAVNPKA